MVDAGRLRALLDRVAEEVSALRRLAALSDQQLRADPERLPGAKYRLQCAIEASIDAAEHVIAAEGFRAPETYAEAFRVLGEQGLLEQALANDMEDAARFRNLLVHGYARVDEDRVIAIIRTGGEHLDAFRRALARYVDEP